MKRILIVKTSSLGDLFHALPAVRALKAGLDAEIDWVVGDIYTDVAGCFTDVSNVIPFPRRSLGPRLLVRALVDRLNIFRSLGGRAAGSVEDVATPAVFHRFKDKMRARDYDYIIDLQGLLKSALICRLARGRKVIGPSFHREGSKFFYDAIAADRDKERHAVDECFDVVRYLGLPVPAVPEFPVVFPRIDLNTSRPRVAFVPCSRWETKNWPPEKFIQVGRSLADMNVNLFLLGSREDKPVCRQIEQGIGRNVENLCAKTRLVDLGSVLQEMDLVITVDSGPMHVAAALGRPVLAVFGATDPMRTGPCGRHMVITHGRLVCQPCLSRECLRPRKDLACLRDLDAQRVIDAAVRILAP